ncbi:MAG: hypothetical protein IJO41_02335 [Oscillospiraceae bacterium]|nr:hypothetical protein [Oscillospiraceae bacterium]
MHNQQRQPPPRQPQQKPQQPPLPRPEHQKKQCDPPPRQHSSPPKQPPPSPKPPPQRPPEANFVNRILESLHLGDLDAGDLLLLGMLFFLWHQKADEELLIALGLLLIL